MLALALLLILAAVVMIYAAYTGKSIGSLLSGGLDLSGRYTPKEPAPNES